ncbi:hypothetical protein B9Z55_028438 [Caenorhabditis nigoni]|uniref:CC domain-containing protein n=1 Tax=Caenorhabditis nigoni TaxID=1611254 RepID=A0A2G5SBG7_9PELO|nr:hypothetical protein B9Z55_028438 [Caenorhabditis nigoni]
MNSVMLFLVVLLISGINTQGSECRVDSQCPEKHACVFGDCLESNHPSGRVITDQNIGEPCNPECPAGQKCTAGLCIPDN